MGRTILCPHCKSTFDEDILKKKGGLDICLVCGESLLAKTNPTKNKKPSFGAEVTLGENDSFDEDKIDFWWYHISEPKTFGETDYGTVYTNCTKCGCPSFTPYYIARTGDYLLMNSKYHDTCLHCGNQLKNHILSKRPSSWVDPRKREREIIELLNIPKCPTCSSTNIKKISTTAKVGSVLVWGVLSRKIHKQWHCNSCGSEW